VVIFVMRQRSLTLQANRLYTGCNVRSKCGSLLCFAELCILNKS
jgi:hypothetical protein